MARTKGALNHATRDARQAISEFVNGNAHRLEGWLDRVAEENPAKAFELFQSVVEYHIPKLARTEVSGPDGGPLAVVAAQMTDDQLAAYLK